MNIKKKLLIVLGVQTTSNPAFFNVYENLKDEFDIQVLGVENCDLKSEGINYKSFSFLYRLFIKLRFRYVFLIFSIFFSKSKRKVKRELWNLKLKMVLLHIEFQRKKPTDCNFVINIDTEAGYISRKMKVKSAFFIYEIYAEQDLNSSVGLKKHQTEIEKTVVQNSSFMISSCNDELGKLLNSKNNCNTDLFVYSVCPEKSFEEIHEVTEPIKFYYHGALFENRGIENAVLAFKDIEGGQFYIRGYGYHANYLKSLVIDNNLENKVFFLEPVAMKDLAKSGVEFDVGVSLVRMNVLNHKYNIGFKTFENISAGLALIVPKSYPLKKLIDTYENGMYYEDATIDDLTNTFNYFIKNRDEVVKWKSNSRNAYFKEYNPELQKTNLINKINLYL